VVREAQLPLQDVKFGVLIVNNELWESIIVVRVRWTGLAGLCRLADAHNIFATCLAMGGWWLTLLERWRSKSIFVSKDGQKRICRGFKGGGFKLNFNDDGLLLDF
jgi:hypothetical protein